jgi:peptidoglycan/LPS O-acetylase OafA/YrhL
MLRRREIDGLRAVAVAPVILWHAGVNAFSGGFVGVDVFFVISGYLITGLIVSEKETGAFTLARFYERRARRILPALLLVVACFVPLAWLWAPLTQFNVYGRSLTAVTVFISNYVFMGPTGYFVAIGQENPLLHTWSLAVEEQYYLVFPILLVTLWRAGRRTVVGALALGAALSFGLAEFYALRGNDDGFYLLPTRAWELLIGALAALTPHNPLAPAVRWRQGVSLVGLAAIVVSVFALDPATAFPSVYALLPTLGAAAILLSATPGTWVNRLLATPAFVGLGLVSYSAYLWHQPLFVFARLRYLHEIPDLAMTGLIALTLLLATLSWRFVETPFRDRRRVSTRQLVWTLAPANLTLLAIGLGLQQVAHTLPPPALPFRNPTLATIDRRFAPAGLSPACERGGAYEPKPQCQSGPAPTLMVWGDSYAMHLVDGIEVANPGRALIQATRAACGPILNVTQLNRKRDEAFATACLSFNKAVLDYLATLPQIADVVLSSSFGAYVNPRSQLATPEGNRPVDVDFVADRLIATVRTIEALGKRVTVVAPPPENGENVGECLEKATLLGVPLAACDFSLADEQTYDARATAMLRAVEAKGIKVVWLKDLLCRTDVCPASEDGVFLYRDAGHLSIEGSRWIGEHTSALKLAPAPPPP